MSMKLGEIMCSVSHVVSAGNNEPKLKEILIKYAQKISKSKDREMTKYAAEGDCVIHIFRKKKANIYCLLISLQREFIQPEGNEMNQESLRLQLPP